MSEKEKEKERERERSRPLAHSCPCRTRMNFELFVFIMLQTKGSLSGGSAFFKKKKVNPFVCVCVTLQKKGSLSGGSAGPESSSFARHVGFYYQASASRSTTQAQSKKGVCVLTYADMSSRMLTWRGS